MADNENPSTPTPAKRHMLPAAQFAESINKNLQELQSIKPSILTAQDIAAKVLELFLAVARQTAAVTEAMEELKKAQIDGHQNSDRDPAG